MRAIALLLLLASPAVGQITGYADYLYWQANSSDFHHWKSPEVWPTFDGLAAEHDGSSGLRAGIGYRLDRWEASWNYTFYASDAFAEWSGTFDVPQYGSSDDDLDYQVHDLQLMRRFCVGECCELDIFGGFRWGQVDRTAVDSWLDGIPSGFETHETSISKTDSYGGRLGGRFRVQLTDQFSWFATGAFSGLVSTSDRTRHDLNNIFPGNPLVLNYHEESRDTHETHSVEASTGLSWTYRCAEVAAGYEWHIWSNIIYNRNTPFSVNDYRDLVLEGLFARLAFVY